MLSCRPSLTLPFTVLAAVVAIIAGVILSIWGNVGWTALIRQCLAMKILGPESAFIHSPGRSFTAWLIDRRLTCIHQQHPGSSERFCVSFRQRSCQHSGTSDGPPSPRVAAQCQGLSWSFRASGPQSSGNASWLTRILQCYVIAGRLSHQTRITSSSCPVFPLRGLLMPFPALTLGLGSNVFSVLSLLTASIYKVFGEAFLVYRDSAKLTRRDHVYHTYPTFS